MGSKKSGRKAPPKRKTIVPLETDFDCPFCNHANSCDTTMDKTRGIAQIICRVCHEGFQTAIHRLSEPIDVYNDWIDACESNNNK